MVVVVVFIVVIIVIVIIIIIIIIIMQKYKTHFTGEITLHVAQIVNTEQL